MSKLPSVITLALIATLLAGCTSTPAEEPDARAASSASASPSAAPADEETETPAPEETTPPAPVAPSPEPSPEPPLEPVVVAPEEPVTYVEPSPELPAAEPFVPPPHGEPDPTAPVVADGTTPHSDPAYFENVGPIYPQPAGTATGTQIVSQGATLTIAGAGYAPGEEIWVLLAKPQSGDNYLRTGNVVHAGPDGSYSLPISIGATMPVGDYGVMTWTPAQADSEAARAASEASKRYHDIMIVGAGS